MSERSGYFPYVAGDSNSEYGSSFIAALHAALIKSGVYNGELAVSADGSAMTVTLPAGRAWINGYFYRNDGALTLPLDNADGVLNRIDIVVLRWDVNARSITAQVVKGAPASDAVAPTITRTVEQYDLKLAEISIPAGTTAITQALITDFRLNTDVCGIVTGLIDQVDTTTFYNQIAADLASFKSSNESGFSTWSAAQQAAFNTWLDGIKDALDGDTAGNLLNQINQRAYTTLACTKSGAVYALTGLSATSGKVPVLFAIDTAFAAGDTVTIGGTAYAIQTRDGSALTAGAWAAGKVVTGVADVDSKVLYVEPSAPVGAEALIEPYIDTLTSPEQLTHAGKYAIGAMTADVNTNAGSYPMSDYAVGDFHTLLLAMNVTSAGCQYGTLLVTSPRLGRKLWIGTIWNYQFTAWQSTDQASGNVAAASAGLRNIVILPYKDSAIPTGLADNTLVFRLDVASS